MQPSFRVSHKRNLRLRVLLTAKLLSQLLLAPMDAPFALIDSGKISLTNVHDTGPHVAPKAPTYIQMNATTIQPSAECATQSCLNFATITPAMTMEQNMTIEPTINIGLRPTLSMIAIAGSVLTKKTTPVTPVARSA